MPSLTDIADAIVGELNDAARSWSNEFTASRLNVPIVKREEINQLSVIVTPISRTTTRINRKIIQDVCRFQIGIQQALVTGENDETDPLIELGETIQAWFDQGIGLESMPQTACEETQFGTSDESPWLSVRDIEGLMIYTGVIGLTFRVMR